VSAPCPCGEAHELSAEWRGAYQKVTAGLPATVRVEAPGGAWLVPRIFIAVHGLKADELPGLAERYGFERAQ
jgi:hypothetical protein